MASAPVETILRLRGSRAFQQAATASAKAIGSFGVESERTGDRAEAGWKSVAKLTAGTAAIYSAAVADVTAADWPASR
jgi:hypothetical protein